MINRIKDKQTGEYHDIGGLKCKLVASGKLTHDGNEEYRIETYINTILNVNKLYMIKVTHPANDFEGGCIFELNIRTYIPYWDENEEPRNCQFGCYVYDNKTIIWISDTSPDILYGEETYKIYELPFALEV